jgi:hypothetical protein
MGWGSEGVNGDQLTRMVKVAGSASTGAVARGVKGIFLPLLPVVAAWPEEHRAWAGARRAKA